MAYFLVPEPGEAVRIILYIIWALFVVAAFFALVQAVCKTRRRDQETAAWPTVQATVTGSIAGVDQRRRRIQPQPTLLPHLPVHGSARHLVRG